MRISECVRLGVMRKVIKGIYEEKIFVLKLFQFTIFSKLL